MPELFNQSETGFTKTAKTLVTVVNQGLSFPTWGNPEREKINASIPAINRFFIGGL